MRILSRSPARVPRDSPSKEVQLNRFLGACLAVLLAVVTLPAAAAERFVSDDLRVSVRAGKGDDYRIVEVLPSGEAVEVLEPGEKWSRVRTPADKTGWMRSQYLQDKPIAENRLEQARAELERLRSRVDVLESKLEMAKARTAAARERITQLREKKRALEDKLADAENGLELRNANERLKARVDQLEGRVSELTRRNAKLADRDRKMWFAVGAGVLLGGMLIGIIVTRIPWRSRRDRLF
jgi:SH3 domain protein